MGAISWTSIPVAAKFTLPSGNTYWFEDSDVRTWVGDGTTSGAEKRLTDAETAIAALSNATHWLGVTTTALTDGATTNPIVISGNNVTAVNGDIVQTSGNGLEFIFNGNLATPAWQQLGASVGTLKAFAYADEGEATFTPGGSNAASAVTFSGGTTDNVLGADTTFTNASSTVTLGTPVTGALETASVAPFGSAGTLPTWTATVANEELTFSWSAGTLPAAGTNVTVATGQVVSSDPSGDSVVTGMPSSGNTAAAQTITVGTNDSVTAVTGVGTATAAAQVFTGTQQTITVTPKSSS